MVQEGWVSCLACFSLVRLAQGNGREDRRSEFLKSAPSIQARSCGSRGVLWIFRAQSPREKYLNVWPGKMLFVQQVWEGWGESGRRRGEEAERGQ